MIILRNLGDINNYFSQKEFARKDYEGLTEEAANFKRQRRDRLAKAYMNLRKKLGNELTLDSIKLNKSAMNYSIKAYDMYVRKAKEAGEEIKPASEFLENVDEQEFGNLIKEHDKMQGTNKKNVTNTAKEVAEQASNKGKSNTTKQGEGIIKKAVGWVKKHPKTSIGTGTGLAILGTGGYLAYRHNKNKKK